MKLFDGFEAVKFHQENMIFITNQTQLNLCRVIFVTKNAMMKVVDGGEFDVSKRTVAATKLMDDDEVVSIVPLVFQRNIVMQTKDGYFLKFVIDEIPEKKKNAIGVRGMKMADKDCIEKVYYIQNGTEHVIKYKSKKIDLNKLKLNKRDSKGTKVRL